MADADPAADRREPAGLLARVQTLEIQALVARANLDALQSALATAQTVGTAVGILMAVTGSSEDDAFHELLRRSEGSGRPLGEVAEEVVAARTVPAGWR